MIDKKFSLGELENLESIRAIQRSEGFVIPSDYVFFLLNFNNIEFIEDLYVRHGGYEWIFFSFYSLEEIVADFKMALKQMENFDTTFWLQGYLAVGELSGKRILIGNIRENLNKIFLYDNDEDFIDSVSDNIFDFINNYLLIESED